MQTPASIFMVTKFTVICYILLSLLAGAMLTLLPWVPLAVLLPWLPFGLGEWGDNYFLSYATQLIGWQGLQLFVASGWVRGAVTGLGLLNLAMAFWEITHFSRSVSALDVAQREGAIDEAHPASSVNVSNHGRSAHS